MGQANHKVDSEEERLIADTRLGVARVQFNQADWYSCHDSFEELWHETAGPMRPVLQGILQIAVAELHLERGNRRGATLLMGEALGRLRPGPSMALGVDLGSLCAVATDRLLALQSGLDLGGLELPKLTAPQLR